MDVLKFGVFSVSMPEYSPEKSVELLKELGYRGVEWRVAEIKKPYERWDTCFQEEIPAPSEDDPKIPYEAGTGEITKVRCLSKTSKRKH